MPRSESPLSGRMVFVVGVRRSGTNWLTRMLGLHPDVAVIASETHLISHGIQAMRERVQHALPTSPRTGTVFMRREEFLDACRDLCDLAFGTAADAVRPGALRIVEHTPGHVAHLDLVGALYPDSTVVHLVRDGRDVARSLAAQAWGPGSPAAAAREWVDQVTAGRTAGPALRSYHEVRYEDLLADPVGGVLDIYGRLGLSWGPELERRVTAEAAVPFNTDPSDPRVGRGKWESSWPTRTRREIDEIAGPLLAELGYPPTSLRRSSRLAALRPGTVSGTRLLRGGAAAVGRFRAAGRARARALLRSAPPNPPGGGYLLDQAQAAVDRFFDHLAARRPASAVQMLAGDARVLAVTSAGQEEAHGPFARDLLERELKLREEIIGDPGAARRSQTFVVHNQIGVTLSFADAGCRPLDELYLLRVEEGVVAQLRYFRFPLVPVG